MHISTSKVFNLLFWVKILAGDRCTIAYLTKLLLIKERCLKIGVAGSPSRSIFKPLIFFAKLLSRGLYPSQKPHVGIPFPSPLSQYLVFSFWNLWPFVKQVAVSYCGFNFIFSKTVVAFYYINWEPVTFL